MRGQIMIRLVVLLLFLTGCSANAMNVATIVLPTSGHKVDVVQSRSDNNGCAEIVTLTYYDEKGKLIDSHAAQGNALHCQLLGGSVQAGAILGGAAILRQRTTMTTSNNNNNSTKVDQHQNQVQGQDQAQQQNNIQSQFQIQSQ